MSIILASARNTPAVISRCVALANRSEAYGEYFRLGHIRDSVRVGSVDQDFQERSANLSINIAEQIIADPKRNIRDILGSIKPFQDNAEQAHIGDLISSAENEQINFPIAFPPILGFTKCFNAKQNLAYQALVFLCRSIPKEDIHAHISGNLHAVDFLKLFPGHPVPEDMNDDSHIKSPKDLETVAHETCRKFLNDGVQKFGLRFNPAKLAMEATDPDRIIRETIDAVREGIKKAVSEAKLDGSAENPEIGIIFSFNRSKPGLILMANRALELCAKDSEVPLLGIDISGKEKGIDANNRPGFRKETEAWAKILQDYKDRGLNIKTHLGDFRYAWEYFEDHPMDLKEAIDRYLEFVMGYLEILPDGSGLGHFYIANPGCLVSPDWNERVFSPIDLYRSGMHSEARRIEDLVGYIKDHKFVIEHCPSAAIRPFQSTQAYANLPLNYWINEDLNVRIGSDAGIFSYNRPRNLSEDIARVMLATDFTVADILELVATPQLKEELNSLSAA